VNKRLKLLGKSAAGAATGTLFLKQVNGLEKGVYIENDLILVFVGITLLLFILLAFAEKANPQ
jgi:hypothetical protein